MVILLVVLVIGGALLLKGGQKVILDKANTGNACDEDGTVDLMTKMKNPTRLNSTADYLAGTLYWAKADSGEEVSSVAQLATGAFKQSSTTTKCDSSYVLYTKNDGAYVFCEKETGPLHNGNNEFVIECPRSSELEFYAFDNAGDNQTAGWVQDTITTTAEAVGSGGTLSYKYLVRAKTAGAQWGSSQKDKAKTYACIDADPSKFSKSSGVAINCKGHKKGTGELPKICSENGYESYYVVDPIGADDGELECKVTIRADLGDPTTDVKIYYTDDHAFTSSGVGYSIGTSDTSASGVGETDRYITINLS